MLHPLVEQLHFTRYEWRRGLEGLSEADATAHIGPMNSISWNVGHLAWQEQRYWLEMAQGKILYPVLNQTFAPGRPSATPSLAEVWMLWERATAAADPYLNALQESDMLAVLQKHGERWQQSVGSGLLRMIYHYWYHLGECLAIRQALGHADLPQFVGNVERYAPYRTR